MIWVQLPTKLDATSARGKESSMAVLSKGLEAKTPRAGSEHRLRPLLTVRVQAGKLFEARPNLLVKAGDSGRVEARRDSPDGENHFAESGTTAQQLKCDLRVRQLAQSTEDLASFGHTPLGVRITELRSANRAAKELEITFSQDLEVGGKRADVHGGGLTTNQDELALILEVGRASTQLKADSGATTTDSVNCPVHRGSFTSHAKVIKVREGEFKSSSCAKASNLGENRVQDQSKEATSESKRREPA